MIHDDHASCTVHTVHTVHSVHTVHTVIIMISVHTLHSTHRPVWLRHRGKVCGRRAPGAGRRAPGGSRKESGPCLPTHTHTHMENCYPALREDKMFFFVFVG